MDQGPLVTGQIEGGDRFIGEYQKQFPVQIAFWIKTSDGEWRLYVASDKISDANFEKGYGAVVRIMHQNPDPWLDPFQIYVIGMVDPMAQAVLRTVQQYPNRKFTRFRPNKFGPDFVEEVYIYPSPEALDKKWLTTVKK